MYAAALLVSNRPGQQTDLDLTWANRLALHHATLAALALLAVGAAAVERRLEHAPEFPLGLVVGSVIFLIVNVWILIAMVIAVRQALDYQTTTRAIVVCIVAWILMLAVQLVAGFFGVGAAVVAGQPS